MNIVQSLLLAFSTVHNFSGFFSALSIIFFVHFQQKWLLIHWS